VLALSAAGKSSVVRRGLVALTVLAVVATTLGPDTPSANQQVAAPGAGPAQEWGDAAGRSHEGGGRANDADVRTLQAKYPPIQAQEADAARNVARVGESQDPAVRGFDAATSRELPGLRKESQRTFENTDGTQTTEFSRDPLNFKQADGTWSPIDTRLVPDGEGWRNAADSVRVWTTETAGTGPVARLELDGKHRLEFGVDGAAKSAGTVDGSAVTYPDVRPDADLRLEVTTRGLKETIALKSPDAPHEWLFPFKANGLTASIADGAIVFRDEKGTERARIPRGFMFDSAYDEHMGEYTTSYGVTYELVGDAIRMTLDEKWLRDPRRVYPVTVDPPVDVRAAASSMYVQRNSDGTNFSNTDDLKVGRATDSGGSYTAASYLSFPGVQAALGGHKIFGAQLSLTNYHSWSCNPRPVTIHAVTQQWAAGTGYSYPGPAFTAAPLGSKSFAHGFIASGTTTSRCPTATEAIPLGNAGRDLVQRWADGRQDNYGLTVRASETDVYGWKKFAQAGTANPPRLAITHTPFNADYEFVNPVPEPPVTRLQGGKVKIKATNRGVDPWTSGYALAYRIFDRNGRYLGWSESASLSGSVGRGSSVTLDAYIKPLQPGTYRLEFTMMRRGGPVFTDEQIPPAVLVLTVVDIPPVVQELYPPNGYSTPSLTPSLWARAVDIDAPSGSAPQYRFEVCDENKANCFDSGRQPSPTWTVPPGRLQWSKTYLWRVYASDGTSENEPTPFSALLTAVPQPEITAHLGNAPYGGRSGEFDPQVGNYTASAVDATVSTIGPKLSVVRTYNSLDPRTGSAFGAGWSSQYDMRITPDNDGSGNVVVTYPDGQQARFGANLDASGQPTGGRLVPPPGRYATLVPRTAAEGGGWTLTDKSASLYVFRPDGRPSEIYDNAGRSLAFTYGTDGKLSTVTNRTSGRKLTVTWSGAHIRTVSTDPVDGTPLTWTYTYDGDRLTQVCDPTDGCTTYEYTPGSHYRSTVVDAKPDSYWRLGESSGTEAQSQIGINLAADKATYKDVALGTTGIVESDTAATFNGTTSAMTLPAGAIRKSRELTVEMWFRTPSGGPLLGIQNQPDGVTPTASVPLVYVDTDGKLRGQFWTGTVNQFVSAGTVNDNQWHHMVLSSTINSQTLYLDGQVVGTRSGAIDHSAYNHSQVGAAFAITPSHLPGWGTAQRRSFAGVIDEVAVYQHPLGLSAVQSHHRARAAASQMSKTVLPSGKTAAEMRYDTGRDRLLEYTDRNGGTWTLGAPMVTGTKDNIIRTVRVADPGNRAHFYDYDPLRGRILRYLAPIGQSRPEDEPPPDESIPTTPPYECPPPEEEPFCEIPIGGGEGSFPPVDMQGARTFTYDANGFQSTITDELGKSVTLTHDARGNVTSRKTCRTGTSCQTAYFEYTPVGSNLTDPRLDKVIATRDGRSVSATDNRYRTAYTYTTRGDLETQTTPDGAVVRHVYTTDTTPAVGGGNTPAGLVHTTTNPRGAVTSYGYFSTGDLAEIRSATGLVTRFTYDELGRRTTSTEISDSFPNGVTTTVTYDKLSRPTITTAPAATNAVTGETHRLRTTTTYDADGNPTKAEADDIEGDDPTRVATLLYDEHNRVIRMTDAEGNETSFGYDAFGNTTRMVDATGVQYDYTYTRRNKLAEVRLRGWTGDPDGAEPNPKDYLVLASYAYALNGELTSSTDAMGRTTAYRYYDDGLLKDTIATSRNLVLATNVYDAAGNLTSQTTAGDRVTTYETDAVGRRSAMTADPHGLARRTGWTYDLNGNVTQVRMTGRESNTGEFDDLTTAEVVDFGYDPAGRQTSETVHTGTEDLTTTYGHDQRGLVTSTTDPAGATTDYRYDALGRLVTATAPQVEIEPGGLTRPTTATGYDTFGAPTHVTDANGETWRYGYDKLSRLVSTTSPEYTPPGGNPITATSSQTYDAMGRVTTSTNPRGAVTRYEYDQLGRMTTQTDPHADQAGESGGAWQYSYTRTGELLSATDPMGARSEYTYDDLGRLQTTSELERYPTPGTYTSEFTYDDASNLLTAKAPSGATATYAYDKLNQLIRATDPSGVVTSLGYDRSGRQATTADAAGRKQRTHYDLAGRPTQALDLSPAGVPLRKSKFAYDRAGNLASVTNPLGHVTRYTSDALGRLQEQVEPVSATESITTTFGYDAAGNRTRYTDGRGNTTEYTVNEWGLPESVIEPSTTAHPDLADRTWTVAYDAAANPVRTDLPGNVERTNTYDLLGRMTGATATDTAAKSFDHDALGRTISASTPAGENRFTYNDRGALLSTGGPSGDTNYTYDADGNVVSRTDASGTATFGYTTGRLATMQDSITGVTQVLDYDDAGLLSEVDYGNGRLRQFDYDDLGRVTLDELTAGSTARSVPTPLASIEYGYDLNDRLTTKETSGLADEGVNTYDYDRADRLTSWTQPTGTTTAYGWDAASNRVTAGTKTATYDERNRLQSDGTDSYTYTPRGTLSSKSGSPVAFDGFDRLKQQGAATYTYDALDRVATRNGARFTYSGATNELATDGSTTFGRGPWGELLSTQTGADEGLAVADQRGDVIADLPAAGSAISDSTAYDPWGTVTDGTERKIGFQGDYTDPDTDQVNMTARWYDPATGRFTSRDDIPLPVQPAGAANRYGYGLGAPTNYTDPTGHFHHAQLGGGGGGGRGAGGGRGGGAGSVSGSVKGGGGSGGRSGTGKSKPRGSGSGKPGPGNPGRTTGPGGPGGGGGYSPLGVLGGWAQSLPWLNAGGFPGSGVGSSNSGPGGTAPGGVWMPPPPDPAIAARAANRQAAVTNPLPVPAAMQAPLYGSSATAPVSSAPHIPSKMADAYQDPVDDVQESYRKVQEALTNEKPVLHEVAATTSAPSEFAPSRSQIHLDDACHQGGWDRVDDTRALGVWTCDETFQESADRASTAEHGPLVVFPDDGAEGRLREWADDIKNSTPKRQRPGTLSETVGVRPSGLLVVVQTKSGSPGAIPGGLMSALIACGHAHGGCSEVSGAARLMQLGATPISVTTVGVQSKRIGAGLHGQVLAPCASCARLLSALGIVSAGGSAHE
jgi:RHS repeat-associated protein